MKVFISYFTGAGRDRRRVESAQEAEWALVTPEKPLSRAEEDRLREFLRKQGFISLRPGRDGAYLAGKASQVIEL